MDLDLSKYKVPAEGKECECRPVYSYFCDERPYYEGIEFCPLHEDAPLLLAEVRRLREENAAKDIAQDLLRDSLAKIAEPDRGPVPKAPRGCYRSPAAVKEAEALDGQ